MNVVQAPGAATQFDSLLAAEQLQHIRQGEGIAAGETVAAAGATAAVTPVAAATPEDAVTAPAGAQATRSDGAAQPASTDGPAAPVAETQQPQPRQQGPPAAGGTGPLCSWVSPTQQERVRRWGQLYNFCSMKSFVGRYCKPSLGRPCGGASVQQQPDCVDAKVPPSHCKELLIIAQAAGERQRPGLDRQARQLQRRGRTTQQPTRQLGRGGKPAASARLHPQRRSAARREC